MQVYALREIKSAYYYSVASQQLKVISHEISFCEKTNCSELITHWNLLNRQVLPNGIGNISENGANIFWGEFKQTECEHDVIGNSGCLHLIINKS